MSINSTKLIMPCKSLFSLLLIISSILNFAYADDSALYVDDAWIAEAPPVSTVMVAYMTINNTSQKAIEITAAESEIYSSIEFHETVFDNGLARMRRHNSLIIKPNTSLQLKRGGLHLMLFNPKKRLKAGDTINIRFTTKDDVCQTINVTVKKAQY